MDFSISAAPRFRWSAQYLFFSCSYMEPETPCADGSHVLIRSMPALASKTSDTGMSVFTGENAIYWLRVMIQKAEIGIKIAGHIYVRLTF